ncbi:MAG: TonB C-terminal domain-containing protein [Deltaproteobacteria bacterium]|nr:TonB C-terminal domain-containing protein [Deltaproteobacteria bacterium]
MTLSCRALLLTLLPEPYSRLTTKSGNQLWYPALGLSLLLHLILLLPLPGFKSRVFLEPTDLLEISLLDPKPESKPEAKPKTQPTPEPDFKRKTKVNIDKNPTAPKKEKKLDKESALAKKPSLPNKKTRPEADKLAPIKERLAQQREAQRLNQIRERLRRETDPKNQARQMTLLNDYSAYLTAWLMRNWHLPEHLLNSGLEASISLTLDASGNLLRQKEDKLSGNPLFDSAMRQAVTRSSPFPPFPEELQLLQEEFIVNFNPKNLRP